MLPRSLHAPCLFIVAVSIAACGPLSNDDVRDRYPVADVAADPVDAASAPAAESGYVDCIENGSFEDKDEAGRPRGWAISPPEILIAEPSPAVYPYDGGDYMMLRSVGESFGVLSYTLKLDASVLGKTVVATAQGRAPLWRDMFLSVRYAVNGEYSNTLHEWPACPNTWTENIARERIPADADPASIEVRILIRDKPGFTFCIDRVRAFVVDGDV